MTQPYFSFIFTSCTGGKVPTSSKLPKKPAKPVTSLFNGNYNFIVDPDFTPMLGSERERDTSVEGATGGLFGANSDDTNGSNVVQESLWEQGAEQYVEHLQLVKLYILADKLQESHSKNAVIDSVVELSTEKVGFQHLNPGQGASELAYSGTSRSSSLR